MQTVARIVGGALVLAGLMVVRATAAAEAAPSDPSLTADCKPVAVQDFIKQVWIPFSQKQRVPAPPPVVERGRSVFTVNCAACHGRDLRGGDQGGPNLLRSNVAMSDQHGELIKPIVRGARQDRGMPAFTLPDDDVTAVAEYIHSVQTQLGMQGSPPEDTPSASLRVLVGDARAGKTDFATQCSGCHSVSGDLRGVGAKFPQPRDLQNTWIAGSPQHGDDSQTISPDLIYCQAVKPTVTVRFADGERVSGALLQVNDFVVTLAEADGTRRTITRDASVSSVDVNDPSEAHRKLARGLSDKTLHDVTAYLATLK